MSPTLRGLGWFLFWLALAAATISFASVWLAKPVKAHGDAAWIMEAAYVDQDGIHCCGPTDCRREKATMFREASDGVHVLTGDGQDLLMPRKLVGHGLYPSIDDDWWICVRGGAVKCIFKPTTGG